MLAVAENGCTLPKTVAPIRVLLVVEDPGDATLMQECLRGSSYLCVEVCEARLLRETLARRANEHVDALLLDLPPGAGAGMISKVRAQAPQLPIVALSGWADEGLAHQVIAQGAQDVIHKAQLRPNLLWCVLQQALGRPCMTTELGSVLEHCPTAAVVVQFDRTILYANQAARALLSGHTAGPMPKLPTVLSEPTRKRVQFGYTKDDAPCWVKVTQQDIGWHGTSARLLFLSEVTLQKRMEQLQERLERTNRLATAGQLAATVAHEVNNPATYVIGNISELSATLQELRTTLEVALRQISDAGGVVPDVAEVDAQLEELIELSDECGLGMDKIVQVVRELRDFSRVDTQQPTSLDVNLLLRTACRMTERVVRRRAVLQIELGPVPMILGNRYKLEQVFTNLLINAAQAVELASHRNNWVRVTSAASDSSVVIQIADSGCGIAPEVLRHVYEPFFTTKPRGVGTGLGLSVSRQIVQAHGGAIAIDSHPGHGTTFELSFPIHRVKSFNPSPRTQPTT